LGSIERCFVLGWWDVSAVAVQPGLVEPVHPGQGGEFELVDVVPAGGVGSVDALGLVQAVGRLGERVVIGVRDRPDRGTGTDLPSRSVKRTEVNCDPASEWATSPISRCPPRVARAISRASRTIAVFMFAATRQPTMRRLNASTMKHTYAIPDRVGT
jgi:hypothetical protein